MGMGRISSTGMAAAMEEMDVISNNIANQSTTGFKQSNINFSDLFPSGGSGVEAGMGVDVSSIQQNFNAVGSSTSGINTNMAIKGSGFFVVKDPSSGQLVYSRNGAFKFDSDAGFLMLGTQRAQGFMSTNGSIPSGATATDLTINTSPIPAVASTTVSQAGVNLSSLHTTAPTTSPFNSADPTSYTTTSSATVYDSLGNPTIVNLYYVKSATTNEWSMYSEVNNVNMTNSPTTLTFNTSGNLTSPSSAVNLGFSPTTGAATPQTIALSLSGMTQNAGGDSTGSFTANGSLPGTFKQVSIDGNGKVYATYTNGTFVLQGQVALATFPNQQALSYLGDAQWIATSDAGTPNVIQSNSLDNITPGALENSNVNVADQLVKLISAQNAFQANAQAQQTYSQVMQTVTKL